MEAFDIVDFNLNSKGIKQYRKKEIFISVFGIIILAFLSSLGTTNTELWSDKFWTLYLVELIAIALIWNGSMFIIQLCVSKISIFKHPFKLITTQTVLLTILVVSVVISSYMVVTHILKFDIKPAQLKNSIFGTWLITFLISSIYATVGFFIQWKENHMKAQYFERATLEAKYETLKTQLNPHFVFNSLNTLLAMVECNPEAVKYVESLSDFLRYILQTREKEAVLLRDELATMNQYIFIQKSRFGNKLRVDLDIPESYYHFAVPPLALQILLENAIKHNVISKDSNLVIRMFIEGEKYIVVENKINRKEDVEVSTGIGLNNIKSRYLFLSGKEVKINEENGIFKVSLPLIEYTL